KPPVPPPVIPIEPPTSKSFFEFLSEGLKHLPTKNHPLESQRVTDPGRQLKPSEEQLDAAGTIRKPGVAPGAYTIVLKEIVGGSWGVCEGDGGGGDDDKPKPEDKKATKLVIKTQPGDGTVDTPLERQPVLEAHTDEGKVDTSFSGSVACAIESGPDGASITGGQSAQAQQGVATFEGLKFDKPGDYKVKFSSGELAPATSEPFKIQGKPRVLEMSAEVVFDFDRSVVKFASGAPGDAFRKLKAALSPDESVYLVGHTDVKGSDAYNEALGLRRAKAVQAALCGDPALAERLLQELYDEEGRRKWGNREAEHLIAVEGSSSIEEFQRKHGLAADGIAGPQTFSRLIPAAAQGMASRDWVIPGRIRDVRSEGERYPTGRGDAADRRVEAWLWFETPPASYADWQKREHEKI
ncbi:MAG: hypothetical protein D6776_09870, partial [Planctomycetota bacterium]